MRQKLEIPFLRAKTINTNTLEIEVPSDFGSPIRVSIYHNLVDLLLAARLEKQAEQLACASLMEEAQLLQQALQCCKPAGLLYQKGGS